MAVTKEIIPKRFVPLVVVGLILVAALAAFSLGMRNEEDPSETFLGTAPAADFNFETGEGLIWGGCHGISGQLKEKELFSARVLGDAGGLTEFGNDAFRFFFPSGWTAQADHDVTAMRWWIGPSEEADRVLFAVVPFEPIDTIARSTRWMRPVVQGLVHSQAERKIGENVATILEVKTVDADPESTHTVVIMKQDGYAYAFADYEVHDGPRADELRNGFERMYSTFSMTAAGTAGSRERDRFFVKAIVGGAEKVFPGSLAEPAGGRLTHVSHRNGGSVHVSIRAYDGTESGDFMRMEINAPDLRPGTYDGSFGWYGDKFSYQSKCTYTLHEGGSLTGELKGSASCARLKGYGQPPTASEPIEGLEFSVKMRGVGCAVGD